MGSIVEPAPRLSSEIHQSLCADVSSQWLAVLKAGSLLEGVLDVSDVWLWLEDSLLAWPKLLKTALESKTFLLSFLPFFFPPPFLSSILLPSSFLPLLYPSFPLSSIEVRPILHSLNYPLLLFFSCSVMSESLRPHGLQHARLPCLSLSHQVCSNSCPLSQWCHPTISFSVARFSSCSQSFPGSRSFSRKLPLCIRWPKYWSFSLSNTPSNEYSGLIFFRIDWFDFLAVQGALRSLLQHHSSKASILQR